MECSGGNLISDAMLARVADQGNSGSRSSNSEGIPRQHRAGEVTKGKGESPDGACVPEHLSTFEVTRRGFWSKRLENGVSKVGEGGWPLPQALAINLLT